MLSQKAQKETEISGRSCQSYFYSFVLFWRRGLLIEVGEKQVVQPVGGYSDEFCDAETDCVAKNPERDRHSIFLRGMLETDSCAA